MAARQQFQQGTRASQMGVGYGEAQVAPQTARGGNIAGDIRQARALEQKKKKAKEKELDLDDAGDVLPIYQTMLGKENNALYEWGKKHQDDEDFAIKWNQKKMEHGAKIAEAREESKRFRTLQGDFDRNKNYNKDSLRSADLSMDYASVLDDKGNQVFTWEEGSDVVKDANKGYSEGYASKGFKELSDIMRPQVNFSKDKNKFEFIDSEGRQIMTSTESFTKDQARNLILNNMKTMDNDFYQSGLNQMDDSDKKNYGDDINGVAEWYADEYADEFLQQYKSQTVTPAPKGSGYSDIEDSTSWDSEARNLDMHSPYFKEEGDVRGQLTNTKIYSSWTPYKDVKVNLPITDEMYPLSFGETEDEDEEGRRITYDTWEGADAWRKSQGTGVGTYYVSEIDIVPVYKKGTKGKKSKQDMSGLMVEDGLQKEQEGKWEYKPMVILKGSGSDSQSVYIPLDKIEAKISPKIKNWNEVKSNMDLELERIRGGQEGSEEISYTDTEESGISRVMKMNNISREEAIKALRDAGKIK